MSAPSVLNENERMVLSVAVELRELDPPGTSMDIPVKRVIDRTGMDLPQIRKAIRGLELHGFVRPVSHRVNQYLAIDGFEVTPEGVAAVRLPASADRGLAREEAVKLFAMLTGTREHKGRISSEIARGRITVFPDGTVSAASVFLRANAIRQKGGRKRGPSIQQVDCPACRKPIRGKPVGADRVCLDCFRRKYLADDGSISR